MNFLTQVSEHSTHLETITFFRTTFDERWWEAADPSCRKTKENEDALNITALLKKKTFKMNITYGNKINVQLYYKNDITTTIIIVDLISI